MGTQNDIVRDVESILHVAGRMVFGDIEGLKIVVVQFHIWALNHFEPQTLKDFCDLHADPGDGVQMA